MAVIEIYNNGLDVKDYQCLNTDLEASYPTDVDCDAGSMLEIIDQSSKVVIGYKVFNGATWNSL